ncbi:MAG: 3-phosphoshikimate 1-carboxyvinyltransferase, partial [Rickettsiales bacterium]
VAVTVAVAVPIAFPIVAALIVRNAEVVLPGIGLNPHRNGLLETLIGMGASLDERNPRDVAGEPVADLVVRSGPLRGVTVPAERAPSMIDEYPILAVAAAFAAGETRMCGLSELRVKESDRLAAIADGLRANGVEVAIEGDDLIVTGRGEQPKGGGLVEARHDHRIAMSFLVMGMGAQEAVSLDDMSPVDTSFPGFADLMNGLGGNIEGAAE